MPSLSNSILSGKADRSRGLVWLTDYVAAVETAAREKRMLFILFRTPDVCPVADRFEADALTDQEVRAKMAGMILLRLPLNAKLRQDGRQIELSRHAAFAELQCLPGLAIIDYEHADAKLHGYVVSLMPF